MKSILFLLFFISSINVTSLKAHTLYISPNHNSLGVLNGEVIDEVLRIEKSLNNPVILSIKRSDLTGALTHFYIKNAKLLNNYSNKIMLSLESLDKFGRKMTVLLGVNLFINGSMSDIYAIQDGSAVKIELNKEFKVLELIAVNPIEIVLNRAFKGEFKVFIDIEG